MEQEIEQLTTVIDVEERTIALPYLFLTLTPCCEQRQAGFEE
jgi:hypothetical protein